MRRLLLLGAAASLVATTAVHAHHSYAATYDVTRQVKAALSADPSVLYAG